MTPAIGVPLKLAIGVRVLGPQVGVLQDFFNTIEDWKQNWRSLSVEDEQHLYKAVSESLEAAGKASLAHSFLIKYLSTFTENSDLGEYMWF